MLLIIDIILLALIAGALGVIFLEVGFCSNGIFCEYFILILLVAALFSPGLLVPTVILGILGFSLVFDFFLCLSGLGKPEPHPLGVLLGSFIVFFGSALVFLFRSSFDVLLACRSVRGDSLRWS